VSDSSRMRYTTSSVTFAHHFTLGANPELFPAGTYRVEIGEERQDLVGHVAWLRTETVLMVRTRAGTRDCSVKAQDLDRALREDRTQAAEAQAGQR
jgi:hypothetical protein